MRELQEETGVKLKLNDIASSPYVDLFQANNLNPHKGKHFRTIASILVSTSRETEGLE